MLTGDTHTDAAATGEPTTGEPRGSVLTMYSTTWCGYCHRLKSQLDRAGIGYQEINIEEDLAAAEFVMSVNGGNQTVPTVRFADGTALTNPSITQVSERLAAVN